MSTRAGVGYSDHPDSEQAALAAARAALAEAGERCDLALVFATSRHDQESVLRAVRSVVGPRARILGGGTAGIITNRQLGYDGAQLGVAVLASDSLVVQTFSAAGLAESEEKTGRALGLDIRRAVGATDTPVVLMYESVKQATGHGPILNMGTPLLRGLKSGLEAWPPLVGLALHQSPAWKPGRQYFDDRLDEQTATAFTLKGDVRMDTVTITNLKPMSSYRRVTRTDGAALLEIDGRPALDVIAELVGPALPVDQYPLSVTLGVNKGDKFGEFSEDHYAIHLCVAVDTARRALLVDNFLEPGVDIQLMRRHIDFAEIRRHAARLVERVAGRRPFLALYIDCAGRAATYAGTDREEATEVQAVIGDAMPLFGIYSGGEISRVGGDVQRLTNAGVLSIFSE
jgi:hypothetical protein